MNKITNIIIYSTFVIALFFLGKYIYQVWPRYEWVERMEFFENEVYYEICEKEEIASLYGEVVVWSCENEGEIVKRYMNGWGDYTHKLVFDRYSQGFDYCKVKDADLMVCYTKKKVRKYD